MNMPGEPADATPQDATPQDRPPQDPPPQGDPYPDPGPWVVGRPPLRCPLCAGEDFRSETIRAQGENGMSSHILDLWICARCRYTYCFHR